MLNPLSLSLPSESRFGRTSLNEPGNSRISVEDAIGNDWTVSSEGPIVLVGTGNKAQDYNRWAIVVDMWAHFHRILADHDLIIMSGYGWGDSEINAKLRRWVLSDRFNRLFFLHKEFESEIKPLLTPGDSSLWNNSRIRQKQMHVIPKWLSDVDSVDSLVRDMAQASANET
jgi:hypothetical protein